MLTIPLLLKSSNVLVFLAPRWLHPCQEEYLMALKIDIEEKYGKNSTIKILSTIDIFNAKSELRSEMWALFSVRYLFKALLLFFHFLIEWKVFLDIWSRCKSKEIRLFACADRPTNRLLYSLRQHVATSFLATIFYKKFQTYDVLVINCSYDTLPMAACRGFRRDSKLVIEFQHGVVHREHSSYTGMVFNKSSSPNIFYAWDQPSASHLYRFISSGGLVSRSSYLSFISSRCSPIPVKTLSKISYMFSILFTLTWDQAIPPPILKLIRNQENGIFWNIRSHPVGLFPLNHVYLRQLRKQKNIYFDEEPSDNLVSSLLSSQLHLTFNSSASIQAAYCKVNTIFLCVDYKHVFESYYPLIRYCVPEQAAFEIEAR